MQQFELFTSLENEFIEITAEINDIVESSGVNDGICCVYIPHTTAGIFINETDDARVITDIIDFYNNLVPYDDEHEYVQGRSDAHFKSCFTGTSETIIIENGKLKLGDWQGIYLAEFNGPRKRTVYVKIIEG